MRRDDAWLLDILIAARDALEFTKGLSFQQFESDRLVQYATLRVLTIIGEAANQLSHKTLASLADIPWPQIVSFRNQLMHGYFDVDLEEVWSVVQNDLGPLIRRVEPLVPPDEAKP
jgi:uncharacterized protein with HEPN domain